MNIKFKQFNLELPSWAQWRRLPNVFTKKDWLVVSACLFIIVVSGGYLLVKNHYAGTEIVPDYGGEYREGIIGMPRYINPALAPTNDADRDIVRLVFSGLMKYDAEENIVPDLAENYTVSEDGKVYTFTLKENLKWHDGVALTADDIIYTIQIIQNIDYASPIRMNWQGVEAAKIDDRTISFTLSNPYAPFLLNTTLGIIPRHIWQGISALNFSLAEYNFHPIGSGAYKIGQIQQDKDGNIQSIQLDINENYYGKKPYLKNIVLIFYKTQKEAINAFNTKEVDGINYLSAANKNQLDESRADIHRINLPRYFAIFFNQTKNKALTDKTFRQALAYSIDKKEIVGKAIYDEGLITQSPILPWMNSYTEEIDLYGFAPEQARNILESSGWTDPDSDGIREKKIGNDKEPTILSFALTTIQQPGLEQTANLIKEYGSQIGAQININIVPVEEMENIIKQRDYEALLFGEFLTSDPDPFSFWHSSQKKYPGLNLAMYDNSSVDVILEKARQMNNAEERAEKYREFQKLIAKDLPAIFLYSDFYLYVQDKKIQGMNLTSIALPSERFLDVENWYIKTKRISNQ